MSRLNKPFCMRFLSLVLSMFCMLSGNTQEANLQSGPMVGYSTMREVMVWVQTTMPADVFMTYKDDEDNEYRTPSYRTDYQHHYIAKLIADQVEPGHAYNYNIYIDGKRLESDYETRFVSQPLWQWRHSPPSFRFATGSCFYINESDYDRPGKPYGKGLKILDALVKDKPDMMLWLGDNTYYREADYTSRTGMVKRHTHTRSLPELQPLLANVHHYAIWDDHDFGPNDSNRSFELKATAQEVFEAFWANPVYDVLGQGGITGKFSWVDCDFFLLDNRYHRGLAHKDGQLLGQNQITWLIESLRSSRASFKFIAVGGQFLSDAKIYENHANYETERAAIIEALDKYDIHGVVFLTGDRHSSEITKLSTASGDVFYDITSSALTSRTYDHRHEANTLRMPGTSIDVNNYALIEVAGELNERTLTVLFKNENGEVILKRKLDFPKLK